MPGEFGAPYREPCGGWPAAPRLFLAACKNHYRKDEAQIQLFENTTTEGDPPTAPENGSTGPANTCTDDYTFYDNCFRLKTGEFGDFSSCWKQGYKAVHAYRHWHGSGGFEGFGASDPCDPPCAYSETKYLTAEMELSFAHYPSEEGGGNTVNITAHIKSHVLSTSGKVIYDIMNVTVTDGGVVVPNDDAGWYTDTTGDVGLARMFANIGVDCAEDWSSGITHIYNSDFMTWLNAGTGTPMGYTFTKNAETISPTLIHLDISGVCAGCGIDDADLLMDISVTTQLSDTNEASDVYADVNGLLGEWDMADDVVYPWRTDAACNGAPMVRRDEAQGAMAPAWDIIWGHTCPWSADTYTGDIWGKPLPKGYSYPPDMDPPPAYETGFYNFRLEAWQTGHATESTSDPANWPDGAIVHLTSDKIYARKWAMIKARHDSYNFFRPCGADRDDPAWPNAFPICGRIAVTSAENNAPNVDVVLAADATYLRTNDLVDFSGTLSALGDSNTVTVTDATHFSVVGTLEAEYTAGGFVMSSHTEGSGDRAEYYWNDTQPKGDYVYKRWDWDMCSAVSTLTCSEACLLESPCAPAVLCVSPNAENFPNGDTYAFPTDPPSHVSWGEGKWQAICRAVMEDPLGVSAELFEARCSPPDGAPPLPESVDENFGCVTEANCAPPALATCWSNEEYEIPI